MKSVSRVEKELVKKKFDGIAPRGTLGVRCPTLKMLCGALTSILFFFSRLFFGSISVSGQLPTYPYPSPNPIVGLGDGVGGAVAQILILIQFFYSRYGLRRKGGTARSRIGLNYFFALINQVVDLVVKRHVTAF